MKLTCLGITTLSRPVNSFELPCQFMGWDIRYLWTLVLKDWILNCFGNAHAGNAFHFIAVRVKKSFWNFDVRTILKITARPWVVVPALVSEISDYAGILPIDMTLNGNFRFFFLM